MAKVVKKKTINYNFSQKHKDYIKRTADNMFNFAEGAVRAGKTVDHIFAFAHELKTTEDRIHIATGSTEANAKLNIGDCNGYGLEYYFRGQCHWGKFKGNECLYIKGPSTGYKEKVVIFAGGAKADSFKKIRGNSYGMWIATEINLHHDNTIKEVFNRTIAAKRRKIFFDLNPDNPNSFISNNSSKRYIYLILPLISILYLLLAIGTSPNFVFIVVNWKSFGLKSSLSLYFNIIESIILNSF